MLIRKNWARIAVCSNEQLRLNLIQAKGEIALGLAKGFPQYFLREDEAADMPDRPAFIALVETTAGRSDELTTILRQLGVPWTKLTFSGGCKGSTDGVSYANGGYNTVANGYGEYF